MWWRVLVASIFATTANFAGAEIVRRIDNGEKGSLVTVQAHMDDRGEVSFNELEAGRSSNQDAVSGVKIIKTAVYGGAFDPITTSHLMMASELVASGLVEEVWIIPCGARPDKPSLKMPASERFKMAQIAAASFFPAGFPYLVNDMEVDLPQALYTYDQLAQLRSQYDDREFFFPVGTDWLQKGTNLRKWESRDWNSSDPKATIPTGDKLVEEFNFLVMQRPGYPIYGKLEDYGPNFQMVYMPYESMRMIESTGSSTELRKRLIKGWELYDASGQTNRQAFSPAVSLAEVPMLEYIIENGHYRNYNSNLA